MSLRKRLTIDPMPRKRRKTQSKKVITSTSAATSQEGGESTPPIDEEVDGLVIDSSESEAHETVSKASSGQVKSSDDEDHKDDNSEITGVDEDDSEMVVEIENGPSDISELYDLSDDDIDMTKMDQLPQRRKWVAFVGLFLVLLMAVAYFGYRVFSRDFGNTTGDAGVTISIKAPDNTASGDLVTLEIKYENTKKVDLRSTQIEVFYPDGFYYKSANKTSQSDSGRVFELGELKAGAGGKLEITGQLVGTKGDDKHFSSLLTYQPANFSTNFQTSAETDVHVSSSIIELQVEAPAQVQADQELEYKITFKNTAAVALENSKVSVTYPEGFTYTGADVEPRGSNNDWRIDTLAAGASESITIRGTLTGKSGSTKEFNAQFGVVEIDNSFTVQSQQKSLILIINPEIELSISAQEIVTAEGELTVTVSVKNTSEAEIRDLKVRLDFTGDLLKDSSYGFDPIEKLTSFGQQELTYTTTVKKSDNISEKSLGIKAVITKAKVEGKDVTFSNEATADVKLQGNLSVSAEGRYFDDNLKKIGTGPLPPVVSQDTTYVIYWTISNGSNAVDSFSVSATLPAGVIWEDVASSALSYNSTSRQVSYSTDKLKANASESFHFSVTVSPSTDDIDKLLVLTQETAVSGTDSYTGEQISQQLDRITTDLPNDEGAKGKGVVEGS